MPIASIIFWTGLNKVARPPETAAVTPTAFVGNFPGAAGVGVAAGAAGAPAPVFAAFAVVLPVPA